ncbi:MAG: hypothetical protein KAU94_04045, partial [Verrucomicrobia bacterium]|nr:hypothetical protein [Verrucomicrobiota bacterium]
VEFEPPPKVKVPKMPLKKLQVKMKKPTKPKSTAKITAVIPKLDLHEIQFPDLASSGIGAGLSDGGEVVGFGNMPSFDDDDGLLGGQTSIGNDLEGRFYDFKRSRSGSFLNHDPLDLIFDEMIKFMANDWSPATLARYYRSPRKCYAICMMVPPVFSNIAPKAFGEDEGSGMYWMAHYKGKLVYPEDITFRFVGTGDGILVVRVDGEIVFGAGFSLSVQDRVISPFWTSNDPENRQYWMGNSQATFGDWITLKAGVPLDMELFTGDRAAYIFSVMLAVQVKGVEYELNKQGGPILPVFRTSELSHSLLDAIYKYLPEGEVCLTNGPVFNDY